MAMTASSLGGVLAFCGSLSLSCLMAGIVHEATHAAAARALGGRVVDYGRDGLGLYVDWQPPAAGDIWTVRLVQLAPAIIGWSTLATYLTLHGWPSLTLGSVIAGVAWGVYTLGGGREDYSLAASQQATPTGGVKHG